MTMKTIAQMIAKLPPESESTFAMLQRAMAENALLRAALEQRDGGSHDIDCRIFRATPPSRTMVCNCGHDDANKVLEVTK